jgi:surface polysaccharide O-acyltransferase-like enzyme
MIDHDSSRRLNLLRFPAIIGIVYVHAYGTTISFANATLGRTDTNAVTDCMRILISQCLARIAVPIFFLLSGYLFFANFTWSPQAYLNKLRARLRSLLIPYLFWNLLMLAMVLLAQALPATGPYFPEGALMAGKYTPFQYLNALLGFTRYPIAYHMWFIRDLMLLVLLVPVICVVLRFAALPFFLVVYLCWVSDSWPVLAPGAVGVLFFSLGAFAGIKKIGLFALDRFGPAALFASLPIMLADVLCFSTWFNPYLHRTGLIVEVMATLYLTKMVNRHQRLSTMISTLGTTSFFLYAAHEPLLGIMRTLAYQYVPLDGPYTMLLLYLTIPVLVVVAITRIYRVLVSICPRTLTIITGGR